MLDEMLVHLLAGISVVDGAEYESGSSIIPNDMAGDGSITCFQSLIGEVIKPKSGGVVRGSLLGISDPIGDVICIGNIVPKASIFPKTGSILADYMVC
jgi:hypothetical protein